MVILQSRGVQAGGLARIQRMPHTLDLWRAHRIEIEHTNNNTIIKIANIHLRLEFVAISLNPAFVDSMMLLRITSAAEPITLIRK